jgi:acyl-CoA hydrolase
VIAEVNDRAPRTRGGRTLGPDDIDVVVPVSRPLPAARRSALSPVDECIAAHIAGLIVDGSTVQIGLGMTPEAILGRLTGHRDLGVHSGLISDAVMELMQKGVITNVQKTRDVGVSVAGLLWGSDELFRFADGNPEVELRETVDVHGPARPPYPDTLH